MHPNPAYRKRDTDHHLAFARARGFGVLAVNAEDGPLLSHIPFLLAEDGASADLHLVRSNPICRLGAADAVIAVSGPDGYISPDWYGVPEQVPTWNYVAVHLRGRLDPLPQDRMRDMLDRQSAAYEARLHPKPAWTLDKMSDDALERMMRMILPFRLTIRDIQGTWKLGQNKSDGVRLAAAHALLPGGIGMELEVLSQLMKDVGTDEPGSTPT